MSRYIDADKIEEVIRNDVSFKYLMASNYSEAIINRFKIAEILNDKIPTADVKEVKHGQWNTVLDESILEHYNNDVDTFACSICGIKSKRPTNFCPFCGARMDDGLRRLYKKITDKEVTTNFEKIKAMTLEEMAESTNPFFTCPYGLNFGDCEDVDCIKCTKAWLEREVKQ